MCRTAGVVKEVQNQASCRVRCGVCSDSSGSRREQTIVQICVYYEKSEKKNFIKFKMKKSLASAAIVAWWGIGTRTAEHDEAKLE